MPKKYYWLKLYSDFFSSKRIKKLRSIAGGDTYTIIYLKMQLKALNTDGYLYFDGVEDDFANEIALDIDENPEDVRITIQYLMSVGLLECSEDGCEYFLTYLENNIGSETASTQRVRAFRKRQKEQKTLQCNADETQVKQVGNVEKDIEKDIDIDIEKEKGISKDIPKKKSDRNIIPPTLEMVQAYCVGKNVDAQRFIDYYTSNGWMVGRTKMKDWQAAVRTWENKHKTNSTDPHRFV